MKGNLKKIMIWTFILILTVLFVFIGVQRFTEQGKGGVEGFYKGATIRFIEPHSPGGTYDLWARILVPYLEKHTGAHVTVENMPGASGLKGGAYLYSKSKPDGLTIGILPMPGMILADLLNFEEAKYDLEKFSYIGRIEFAWRGLFASKESGFKSIADMQKSKKAIRFASVDPTSQSSVDAALIAEAFGLKAKILPGYKGSKEYMLALKEGKDIDAAATTLTGYDVNIKEGKLTLIAILGRKRHPDFPDVPFLLEIPGLKPGGKNYLELLNGFGESGRMIVAPPGVPEDKRVFLDEALLGSLSELGLADWAQKAGYNITPLSGRECRDMVVRLMEEIVPKAERSKLKHLVTKKYF